MLSLAEELRDEAQVLNNADFQEADARLAGLLEWMESKAAIKDIIDLLEAKGTGPSLLEAADYHFPPRAKTREEVAAVGLALMRCSVSGPAFFKVAFAKGIRASGSKSFQDYSNAALTRYVEPFLNYVIQKLRATETEQISATPLAPPVTNGHKVFPSLIQTSRIEELKKIVTSNFDFSKLIRMCEELNTSFATECYFAVAMLTRAILDHVPPVFGVRSFSEVSSNYSGSKSFKASMRTLENSSRNIADQHLHCQIRATEALPNAKQVNFSNDLDVLLSEIIRVQRSKSKETPSGT